MVKSSVMPFVRSADADIAYEVLGSGPAVVLLHPFPASHALWIPAAERLISRFTVVLPDLRGHGESELGEGPATMQKHASDIARVMDDAGVGRAVMGGISIGGYALFEFWRQLRARVAALVLLNTKAQADTAEAHAARLQAANDVLERGTEPFFQSMVAKLFGKSTRDARPDLIEGALRMMRKMTPQDVAGVQRGMAERPDSVATLKTINVPTLIVTGEEDGMTGTAEASLMQQNISGSQMRVVPRAGHYAAWEQPEAVGLALRQFLESLKL